MLMRTDPFREFDRIAQQAFGPATGTLFDRPEVVEGAALPAVAGDFFTEVPAGADA